MKVADKIAYLGRDIEDALNLGFLDQVGEGELAKMAHSVDANALNTTVIMHKLMIDIAKNSSPERGICFSPEGFELMNQLKQFNYDHIYGHPRFLPFKQYAELVITQIFESLFQLYEGKHSWNNIEQCKRFSPVLAASFARWLARYCDSTIVPEGEYRKLSTQCDNEKIYQELETEALYAGAILDFISGMTDRFAVRAFNELLTY